ncbi:MAG: mercury resistance system periplasmic binding protein MerP [Steroidobacteraceae bacterium]
MSKQFAALMLTLMSLPVLAADQTVTLSVPGMNCAACPITVKRALSRIPGVSTIEISLDTREVSVTFDDARTSVDALTHATGEAGYPSTLAEIAK